MYLNVLVCDAHVQLYESSVHFLGGVAIVLGAGGRVTNRDGENFNIYDTEALIVSNGKIHEPLVRIVNNFLG